jgi:hypothetical protein
MTGTAAQQAMCGSVRYRDAETALPACLLPPLLPNYKAQPLQNFHVELTSNALFRRYDLMVNETINEFETMISLDHLSGC